jgi:hypothetical protein
MRKRHPCHHLDLLIPLLRIPLHPRRLSQIIGISSISCFRQAELIIKVNRLITLHNNSPTLALVNLLTRPLYSSRSRITTTQGIIPRKHISRLRIHHSRMRRSPCSFPQLSWLIGDERSLRRICRLVRRRRLFLLLLR